MDFFHSLTLDLKIVVAGLAACALLALAASDKKTEKRSMIVFAILAAVGVYRYTHLAAQDQAHTNVSRSAVSQPTPAAPKHRPLESTFAK